MDKDGNCNVIGDSMGAAMGIHCSIPSEQVVGGKGIRSL